MKAKNIFLIFSLLAVNQLAYSQPNIIGNPNISNVTVKKITGTDLIIPIEIDFINTGTVVFAPIISITISNTHTNLINRFSAADLANVRIINNNQAITITPGQTSQPANSFYLFIDRTIVVNCDRIFYLDITEGGNLISTLKITIQPEDQLFTLIQYLNPINVLDYVTRVESSGNVLTINGYQTITNNGQTNSVFMKKNLALENGQVLAINEWSHFLKLKHWQPVPFSIITIPFKVRPEITSDNNKIFKNSASSGITNLGFNLDLLKYQMDRYFSTGKKSSHKLSLGFWAAPSVEEIDSAYTNGYLAKDVKSKQLFFSTGITISYSYNDISFVFVPAGWDIATSTIGKNWVYNGERWWGFGIAISPKIFATILNK